MKKVLEIAAAVAAFATIAGFGSPSPAVNRPKPVRVETGLLSGVTDSNGVTAYKGIPFAAPPVGDLRWRPPQPPARWEGLRKADHFGASCMQNEPGSRFP